MTKISSITIKAMSPQLLVTDITRSIEFYTKKLEFEIDFCHEDFYAGISKGGISIHLKIGKYSTEERQNRKSNEDLNIVFLVDDIENAYTEILDRSVEVIIPLREMDYGKEFYITDPDGYILAFLEEKR
jgi:predicted enzyme related to lactoylglutathione lyase